VTRGLERPADWLHLHTDVRRTLSPLYDEADQAIIDSKIEPEAGPHYRH
jgi:hypothetical protein